MRGSQNRFECGMKSKRKKHSLQSKRVSEWVRAREWNFSELNSSCCWWFLFSLAQRHTIIVVAAAAAFRRLFSVDHRHHHHHNDADDDDGAVIILVLLLPLLFKYIAIQMCSKCTRMRRNKTTYKFTTELRTVKTIINKVSSPVSGSNVY